MYFVYAREIFLGRQRSIQFFNNLSQLIPKNLMHPWIMHSLQRNHCEEIQKSF